MKPTLSSIERRVSAIEAKQNPPLREIELRLIFTNPDGTKSKQWTSSSYIRNGVKFTSHSPADYPVSSPKRVAIQ